LISDKELESETLSDRTRQGEEIGKGNEREPGGRSTTKGSVEPLVGSHKADSRGKENIGRGGRRSGSTKSPQKSVIRRKRGRN